MLLRRELQTVRFLYFSYVGRLRQGDQIKQDEMGGTCGRHVTDEIYMQNFG